jgi:hypothetical protein
VGVAGNVRYRAYRARMTGTPRCYDVTVTVSRDGSYLPNPAEFAMTVEQAASARDASVMSAHTHEKVISIVTVQAADQPAAVIVALAVVSEGLRAAQGRFR